MAEAGAGPSETVTETTVTVTTEPVRKAGRGGLFRGLGGTGREMELWRVWDLGHVGVDFCWEIRKGLKMLRVAQMVQERLLR